MNDGETAGNGISHAPSFAPALDYRKRRIRGLWIRNGIFYAQLRVSVGGRNTTRRFPLAATTVAGAKEEMEGKRIERRENRLPPPGRKPMLSEAIAGYCASPIRQGRRPGTLKKDRRSLAAFLRFAGDARVDMITPAMVRAFCERRLSGGASARTVNLDLISLRGLLKRAVEDGHLREMPRIRALPTEPPPKRGLLSPAQIEALVRAARDNPRSGAQLADFIQLLAFSGMREQEALRLRWADVDFDARRLHVGRDGATKNREARAVEFNPQLAAHLAGMRDGRAPDSPWLFPSARRGADRARRAKSFRSGFEIARDRAGLPGVGFHDFRHYFCSLCVMAGIDYMTIAAWLGHKDGGILVGKVYGHLADDHRHRAAERLNLGIRALPRADVA